MSGYRAVMDFVLADGGRIPAIGIGTWPMNDNEAERAVADAIALGYRLVDTAFAYGNETGVGRGIAVSGLPRDELFITTKFNKDSHSVHGVAHAWQDSVHKLGVDYVDLMLIHWPVPQLGRFVEAWEGLLTIQGQGKVRHIGVSNFLPEHLEPIIAATGVAPVLNQLQITPRYQQAEARAYNTALGIHTQAWSPLGQGTGLLDIAIIGKLADKYGITRGQVVLAWDLCQGMSAIPKSSHRGRLVENLAATSIVFEQDDIDALSAIDASEPDIKHPNSFGH